MGASAERMRIELSRRGSARARRAPVEQLPPRAAGSPASPDAEEVRLKLQAGGFRPIPAQGKKPFLTGWPAKHASPAEIKRWSRGRHAGALNTGIVLGSDLRVIDIDILDPELARHVETLASMFCGAGAPVRVGRAPKSALFYRVVDGGRLKVTMPLGDGRVELLGKGQMVIAHGTHPDTREPYTWRGPALWEMSLASLPVLTSDQEQRFLQALQLLPEAATGMSAGSPAGHAAESSQNTAPRASGASEGSEPSTRPKREQHDGPTGWRNNALFRYLLRGALSCEDEADLHAMAVAENSRLCGANPLPAKEVDNLSRHVWRDYRIADRIFQPGQQVIQIHHHPMLLQDGDALLLLYNLIHAHGAKAEPFFAVSPKAMPTRLKICEKRIARARDRLVGQGFLTLVTKGGRGPGSVNLYRLVINPHSQQPMSGYIRRHSDVLETSDAMPAGPANSDPLGCAKAPARRAKLSRARIKIPASKIRNTRAT